MVGSAYDTRMDVDRLLVEQVSALLPYLNERQRRLFLAAEARSLGAGGIARVARAARVSRPTIQVGLRELAGPVTAPERVRRPGGGRKPLRTHDPARLTAVEALVDPIPVAIRCRRCAGPASAPASWPPP
jgi:hypothetical protein